MKLKKDFVYLTENNQKVKISHCSSRFCLAEFMENDNSQLIVYSITGKCIEFPGNGLDIIRQLTPNPIDQEIFY